MEYITYNMSLEVLILVKSRTFFYPSNDHTNRLQNILNSYNDKFLSGMNLKSCILNCLQDLVNLGYASNAKLI